MLLVIAAVLLLAAAGLVQGARRWPQVTRELRTGLDSQRTPSLGRLVDPHELADLPPPVAGHLRRALRNDQQPRIEAVHLRHSGTFDMGKAAPRWRPFTSEQRVVLRPPAFDWNARITRWRLASPCASTTPTSPARACFWPHSAV